jgi:hypothetical protein
VKRGSKPERDLLRSEMRERGLKTDAVADEMARRFGFRPREAYRHARGWTLDEAARQFNATAAKVGADPEARAALVGTRLSAFEKWPNNSDGRRPSVWVLTMLALIYDTDVQRLLDLEDYRALPERDRLVLNTRSPTRGQVTLSADALPHADGDMSSLVLGVRHGVDDRVVELSARESLVGAEAAESGNVSDATIDGLHQDLVGIALDYVHAPLDPLFLDLLRIRDHAGRLLAGRQPPGHATDLHLIAGRACALLANAAMDYGCHQAGLAHARAAWTFARNAGHQPLMAWTRGIQSSISYWSGRPAESARLAAGGHRYAGSGTTSVFLASLEARAQGRLGDARAVEDAVRRASLARDRAELDEICGVFAFPLAKQHLYAASAHAGLSQPALAGHHASAAIELYENGPAIERSYGDEAGARLDLVLARLAQRCLDGAADGLAPVLALPAELRVSSISQRLDRVRDALAGLVPQVPAARQMDELIASFKGVDSRRELPGGPSPR